jgi:photosystem II stability/assembly factor-like uncharacterized protein
MNWQNTLSAERLPSFHFINSTTGWLAGEFYDDVGHRAITIRKTTNSGLNWIVQYIDTTKYSLRAIYFINSTTGFAGGGYNTNPVLLKTTNSGINWIILSNLIQYGINDIYFLNQNTGWIVSGDYYNGKLQMTTDCGSSWITQYTHTKSLYDIFMKDSSNLWVSCDGGIILYSSNLGNNWSTINTEQPFATESYIWFHDVLTGFAGFSGILQKTTDGGQNWYTSLYDGIYSVKSIFFLNQNTGWAGGGTLYSLGTT